MPHRRRLLLVEDHDELRYVLARTFVLKGWEVLGAANLAEAGAFIDAPGVGFASAIIDIFLPDGTGDTIVARVKAMPTSPRVIMYTACGEAELVRMSLANGADAVCFKPASFPDTLLPLVLGTYPAEQADPMAVIFPDPTPAA